jgi:hypothetical protein
MKKIIPIFIIGIFILSGFGASAESIFNIDETTVWEQKVTSSVSRSDELDQYQLDMDFFAPVGNIFLAPEINYISAQSFIPTKNALTRVEILAGKNSTASHDFTLAIRDDLLGPDLTSLSLPPGAFVTENFSWLEFDFPDINVTTGNTYYIVCYTADVADNWYAWGANLTDVYFNGSVWWSEDDGQTFEEDPGADLAFKTYGFYNLPPLKPEINGPTHGKYGESYDWTFVTTDPEGHDIEYFICWGGTCVGQWYGPYASGEVVTKGYTYLEQGTFTIECIPRDIHGAEGPGAYLTVTMPRDKAVNSLFQQILQLFPNMFPILRYISGL